MRVFIPTTVSSNRMQTCALALPWERTFLVHNNEQSLKLWETHLQNSKVGDEVLVTAADGYIGQLNFIDNCVAKGEWYIKADDNIREFISEEGNTLSNDEAWRVINESINEAEKRRAYLVGFATVDNPFFRKTKFRDVGFVMGKMYAVKHDPEIIPAQHHILDDYDRTAKHLFKYGKVLVNNQLHSKSKHYEPGGIGTWEARLASKMYAVRCLFEDWPNLFREKKKAGKEAGSEVQLRFTSKEQVEAWRLYIRSRYRANGATQ
jgi:hypothetical protein